MNFFLSTFLTWLPPLFFWGVFLCVIWWYSASRLSFYKIPHFPSWCTIQGLYKSVLWFRGGYAVLFTVIQYYIWSQNDFTRSFLNTPLDGKFPVPFIRDLSFIFDNKFGYFFLYSWGRFWFAALLTVCVAWLFFLFLKSLKKYRERFFDEGEIELGFVCALIVGWPNIIFFVISTFIFILCISMLRIIMFRAHYTTFGFPFLCATLFTLLWGDAFITLFNLSALIVSQ